MQGLGMNDGDKGGGTAGAQAKLETSKMILLTVPNLLDQPSYSVDQLHRLALLAARKAKETGALEDDDIDFTNGDTAKDGLDSIITILEKKATAKKAHEHQSLFVGEENERLFQFEVSAKTVHSTTKQFQILKHTSQMSALVLTHDLTRRQLCFAVWTRSVCGHRVPRAAGHNRRINIRNPRIVVAAGEPDCLQRRRRTRFAVVGDCTSDYVGAREECGSDVSDDDCGAGCVGGVGCGCVRRMRRKGKMDEDEEEGITNAQSNELDMNDNLAVRFMNPQIPHSMTPRKSLTMTPIAGPHPSSSKITDIIHASAAAIHAPPRIGSGEADNVAVPDEPAERLGITRHGHTDELGAADQGERHAIGDKATKDSAGAGGRASGGVDLGCGDVARAYPDHGERRTQNS
ncbi:hypothetical protein BLNAU_11213 [Blattamonas nauphoetae]|uniref:Uncharacterized protein n=1 Tax=Blattamonas nauphoetae TaxID=2049346 RepID=A0ABQ9XQM8_9EUKA|nr:hypothetical protein BLNAU_11213 [Blattamonas nauphoetae]